MPLVLSVILGLPHSVENAAPRLPPLLHRPQHASLARLAFLPHLLLLLPYDITTYARARPHDPSSLHFLTLCLTPLTLLEALPPCNLTIRVAGVTKQSHFQPTRFPVARERECQKWTRVDASQGVGWGSPVEWQGRGTHPRMFVECTRSPALDAKARNGSGRPRCVVTKHRLITVRVDRYDGCSTSLVADVMGAHGSC